MNVDDIADFYHREQYALVRFAATIVGPDRADDVVASAMISIIKRFGHDRDGKPTPVAPDSLRAYVYKAVANAGAKDWRTLSRRQRREAIAGRLEPTTGVEAHTGQVDGSSPTMLSALAGLSPRQRAVVHLAYWEDLTPSDIAHRLAISDGAVRRHLARARQKLRTALGPSPARSDSNNRTLLGDAR